MPHSDFHIQRIHAGAWLVGQCVGGFTDGLTGFHVPGVKVHTDPTTRQPIAVTDVPSPVQLPTHRLVSVYNERERKYVQIEERYDYADDRNGDLLDGLNQALAVGLIRIVSDEEMRSKYSALLDKSREHVVYKNEAPAVDMQALIAQHNALQDAERQVQESERKAQDKLAGRSHAQ